MRPAAKWGSMFMATKCSGATARISGWRHRTPPVKCGVGHVARRQVRNNSQDGYAQGKSPSSYCGIDCGPSTQPPNDSCNRLGVNGSCAANAWEPSECDRVSRSSLAERSNHPYGSRVRLAKRSAHRAASPKSSPKPFEHAERCAKHWAKRFTMRADRGRAWPSPKRSHHGRRKAWPSLPRWRHTA